MPKLVRLHEEVDAATRVLELRHAERLQCARGCSRCCVDDITVFEVEADRIRNHHRDLLSGGTPHPTGACAFLDADGACRIYEDRPYVCRTQGLPLRWLDRDENGGRVELRDICPLNERAGEPLESLAPEACWTLGDYEGRLATLQLEHGGSPPRRVALRSLFAVKT